MREVTSESIAAVVEQALICIRGASSELVATMEYHEINGYLRAMREVRMLTIPQHLAFRKSVDLAYLPDAEGVHP